MALLRTGRDNPIDGHAGAPVGVPVRVVERRVVTRHELPNRTIVKVILTLVLLWLLVQLSTLLLELFIALLLTAALDPLVTRLERRGWPRPVSVGLILVALAGLFALVLLIVIPPIVNEGTQVANNLPEYTNRFKRLFHNYPEISKRINNAANTGAVDPGMLVSSALAFGTGFLSVLTNLLLILTMAAYLLVDGERVYSWVAHYLPMAQRVKVRRALPEISKLVSGYLAGQAITSLLFGTFVWIILTMLGMPQALLLALLAAIADAVPIVGVFVATIPPVLIAATISIPTAAIVLIAYTAYQQVENYVIVPRVYRGTMEISSFAVLLAVLVGAELLGIVGALLALPIAAAIPALERIWLPEEAQPAATARLATSPASRPGIRRRRSAPPEPAPPATATDAPAPPDATESAPAIHRRHAPGAGAIPSGSVPGPSQPQN